MRDPNKIRYYRCDELENYVRDCHLLRDQTRATAMMANSESEDDVLLISDEVSTFFQ